MRSIAKVVTSLMAAGLLVAAVAPHAGATHPGRRGRIAYAAMPKGSDVSEIYTRKRDGSGTRRLTHSNRRWDTDPAWSSSGKKIAWSCNGHRSKADPPFVFDLCVMDGDGGDKRRFDFKLSVRSPDFAPNGRHVVYVTDGPDDNSNASRPRFPKDEVWLMRRDGSKRTRVTRNRISEAAVSWSPAGGEVAFVGLTSRGRGGLYVVDLKTREQRLLTRDVLVSTSVSGTRRSVSAELDWSPDGRWIVYPRNVGNAWDVYVTGRTGKRTIRMTNEGVSDRNSSPAWSPDGRLIVYRHAGEGSSGPGWTCEIEFPRESEPSPTDHGDCPRARVTDFDFSWQPRPR